MKTTTVKAFAKVNFILNIKGKLPNGYHELESFMQAIDLYDTVTVSWEETAEKPAGLTVSLDPGAPGLPADAGNLAYRAAVLMHEACHPEACEHIDIKIVKRIPIAAGLAGGSADGAAVLTALARLWDLDPESLIPIASKLGSDVPFCLVSQNGQTAAIATGTGTDLSPADPAGLILYVATPPIDVPTKEVYKETRPSDYLAPAPSFDTALFCNAESAEAKAACMGNHLQAPALRLFPEIGETLKALENSGLEPLRVQLSGSGPTCFAVLKKEPDKNILQSLEQTFAGYKFAGICRSL